MLVISTTRCFEFFSNTSIYKKAVIWCLMFAGQFASKMPLCFICCNTWHLFAGTQRWRIPRGSLMSHSDDSQSVSRSVYIISSSFTTATTSTSEGIYLFIFIVLHISQIFFFLLFDRVWGACYSSAHTVDGCCVVLTGESFSVTWGILPSLTSSR